MALALRFALVDIPLPAYIFVISCVAYLLSSPILGFVHAITSKDGAKSSASGSTLDLAEKGSLKREELLSDEEIFQLEKRAFFSKTWLFVCPRSRFEKAGDYHAFDVAGVSFFVVLGKDSRIRAFHNVCRHRAYTVVRKSCGTSTRFSCKYHGWQYDDQGKLVKAPKFDESPGFNQEENGLFEVKSILTREGLIFVNFDASTMKLPFNNVKSHVDFGNCSWVEGMTVNCESNWKAIANEFSDQAQWSQTPFGWLSRLRNKPKKARLLGPLSMIKELSEDLWYTLTLLPVSASEVRVRCDLYCRDGYKVPTGTSDKWKWVLEQEINGLAQSANSKDLTKQYFAYQCGGE